MYTEDALFSEISALMLEQIEGIPLKGLDIDQKVWTKRIAKFFSVLGGHEVLKRKTVFESLRACVVRNASISWFEHESGCLPSETTSPYALAFAIMELDYQVQPNFSEQCPQEMFFKQYYRPDLLKVIFDQLFPQEEIPLFLRG